MSERVTNKRKRTRASLDHRSKICFFQATLPLSLTLCDKMTSLMDVDLDSIQQDGIYSSSKQQSSSAASSSSSVKIHRVRFPDWQPSSITSIAFPPNNSIEQNSNQQQSNKRSILAIGRENGNIELCVWVGSNQNDISNQKQNENTYTQNDKGWIVHHVSLSDAV